VLGDLLKASRESPLPIERIMCDMLDLERKILLFGIDGYPFGVLRDERLLELLKLSYNMFYRSDVQSIEMFLVNVVCMLKERIYGRAYFER